MVRLNEAVSSSRPDDPRASRAAVVKDGRRPPRTSRGAARVLDGGDDGASLAHEGRDAGTIAAFADGLAAQGGDPEAIEEVCIAMSPAC